MSAPAKAKGTKKTKVHGVTPERFDEIRSAYIDQAEEYAITKAKTEAFVAKIDAAEPARQAAAEAARAQIAEAVAAWDASASTSDGRVRDPEGGGGYLYTCDARIVRALGLLALVKHDGAGFDPDSLEEPMRELAEAMVEIELGRDTLEKAGVFESTKVVDS